jgi:hypothetical protein
MNECSFCQKQYKHWRNLHRHKLQKHFVKYQNEIENKKQRKGLERLFHCEFCNKGYNLKRNLDTHVKKDHSEVYQNDVLKNKSLKYCEDFQFADLLVAENMWNLLFSVDVGQRIPYCCTVLSESIKIGKSCVNTQPSASSAVDSDPEYTIQIIDRKHSNSESKEWNNVDFEDFDFMFKAIIMTFIYKSMQSINQQEFFQVVTLNEQQQRFWNELTTDYFYGDLEVWKQHF